MKLLHEPLTKFLQEKKLEKVDFEQLRGIEWVRKATVDFDGTPIKIGIAHGLGNARRLLEEIREGKADFHAIEIMACPGGCIGGGGQTPSPSWSTHSKGTNCRTYREDVAKPIRKSHENPFILKLYEEFPFLRT